MPERARRATIRIYFVGDTKNNLQWYDVNYEWAEGMRKTLIAGNDYMDNKNFIKAEYVSYIEFKELVKAKQD